MKFDWTVWTHCQMAKTKCCLTTPANQPTNQRMVTYIHTYIYLFMCSVHCVNVDINFSCYFFLFSFLFLLFFVSELLTAGCEESIANSFRHKAVEFAFVCAVRWIENRVHCVRVINVKETTCAHPWNKGCGIFLSCTLQVLHECCKWV